MEPSRPSGASLAPLGPTLSLPQHRLPPGHLQDWSPTPGHCQLSVPVRFTQLRGCWPCPHPQRVRNRKNVQSQPIPECCAQDCFTNKRCGSAGPEVARTTAWALPTKGQEVTSLNVGVGQLPGPAPCPPPCPPRSAEQTAQAARGPGGGQRSGATAAPRSPSGHAPDGAVAADTVGDVAVCLLLA